MSKIHSINSRAEIKACSVCKVDGESLCIHCRLPFCKAHLYVPSNGLVSDVFACLSCAKKANEIMFTDEVGNALTILFGLGLSAVTIHSPNGAEVRYNQADINSGVTLSGAHAIGPDDIGCIVRKMDTGELYVEGIVSQELMLKLLNDMGAVKS